MSFAEDYAPYFADFGTAATLDGQAVLGIFEAASMVVLGGIGTAGPRYTLATAAAAAATQASVLVHAGRTYRVRDILPDGTGITELSLELQP